MNNMNLIDSLIQQDWLKTPRIIKAFKKIKRVDFMAKGMDDLSELNQAFPIGHGQTISQPLTVAFMMEKLQPKIGDKVLDIGSGSGWTTALLSEIIGQKGKVVAIEIISELVEFGKNNIAKYGFVEKGIAQFICGDGSKGFKKESPFDKILCSAAIYGKFPKAWKDQLKIGGRIVTPIDSSIWLLVKKTKNEFEETEYPGFAFVPLVGKKL